MDTTRADDLARLGADFGSEESCRAYLEKLRWPNGPLCPRCGATGGISRIETRGQFECESCGYQFSVRVGTIFHASRLPLWKWFLAVHVMTRYRSGLSTERLGRMLGVSYKTAWYLSHRIRAALDGDARDPADGAADPADGGRRREPPLRDPHQDGALRDALVRLLRTESLPFKELVSRG